MGSNKRSRTGGTGLQDLPEELLWLILSRVKRAKDQARCSLVCTTWRRLMREAVSFVFYIEDTMLDGDDLLMPEVLDSALSNKPALRTLIVKAYDAKFCERLVHEFSFRHLRTLKMKVTFASFEVAAALINACPLLEHCEVDRIYNAYHDGRDQLLHIKGHCLREVRLMLQNVDLRLDSCDHLRLLKVSNSNECCGDYCFLTIPPSLPQLKYCKLEGIDIEGALDSLLACPVLETLELSEFEGKIPSELVISNNSITKLLIMSEGPWAEGDKNTLVLDGPRSLTTLDFGGHKKLHLEIRRPVLNLRTVELYQPNWEVLKELMRAKPPIRYLQISLALMLVVFDENDNMIDDALGYYKVDEGNVREILNSLERLEGLAYIGKWPDAIKFEHPGFTCTISSYKEDFKTVFRRGYQSLHWDRIHELEGAKDQARVPLSQATDS